MDNSLRARSEGEWKAGGDEVFDMSHFGVFQKVRTRDGLCATELFAGIAISRTVFDLIIAVPTFAHTASCFQRISHMSLHIQIGARPRFL